LVLPLRILRSDPETDFLSFSLPDAIATSLSGLDSLLVRSNAVAERYANETPDLERIAREAAVDAVVYGTLLRAGDQVRVSTQLVEAPSGTVLCSRATQVKLQDIFELQDELAREIVAALSGTLGGAEGMGRRTDVPASPHAYELYLRASQLAYDNNLLADARDLYRTCLDEDPQFAPAWARLGRVYRVMAKYEHAGDADANRQLASAAFRRALEINPDLAMAHNLYTYFEIEELGRSIPAMVRLLERARGRTGDAELFAGLVLACRFCGLLEASLAADSRARRLDPGVRTSVQYTYWMLQDWEKAMRHDEEHMRFVLQYTLPLIGREAEAIERYRIQEAAGLRGVLPMVVTSARSAVERQRDECVAASQAVLDSNFHDPEGLLLVAHNLARVGADELALDTLDRVVSGGLYCTAVLEHDPWLEPLRGQSRFATIHQRAMDGRQKAARAFVDARGERLLGAGLHLQR
jgi:TolB-like protein